MTARKPAAKKPAARRKPVVAHPRRRFWSVYVVAYVILVAAVALCFYLISRESNRAQNFDNRRAYELCLTANESRAAIRDTFTEFTDTIIDVSKAPADGPRVILLRKRVAENLKSLGPRNCAAEFAEAVAGH